MTSIYAADYVEDRSRLTTFFRALLIIPHYVVLALWGIAASVAVFIAWFAIVITGRWPAGLYEFTASFARYSAAVSGYMLLLTDVYPPFSGDTDQYPIRLHVGPRQESYSRVSTFFRAITVIPVYVIAYVLSLVAGLGAFIAWFVILVLGRQPAGLQEMIDLGADYSARANAYYLLVSDRFPPFSSPPEQLPAGAAPAS